MSKRQSKRQQQKQKGRERRVRKNRSVLSSKRRAKEMDRRIRQIAPMPEFRIDTTESTQGDIAELVTVGVEGFDRAYTQVLSDTALDLMVGHVANGWTDTVNQHAAYIKDMTRSEVERGMLRVFEKELGDGILRSAPEHLIRRALPLSCFTLQPGERHWDVRCRSLRTIKTDHGSLYQSPHQPTVEQDGHQRQVVFTRHALQQLADRILPSWKAHYIGQAYVFGFLYECVYFEVVTLMNDQPALVIYNSCLRAGSHLRDYMQGMLGLKTRSELSQHYYKVGYCPLVFDGDLAVAKTFLTPGFWHTPERAALASTRAKLSLAQDIEMACDDGINIMSVSSCDRTRQAVQWFHNHGVPQAKRITCEVFRDVAGPYAHMITNIDDVLPTEATSLPAISHPV